MSQGVSDEEIAREVRTLRNLRRRSGSSTGPGALPLDPDLPPPSPSSTSSSFPSYSSNDDITLATPDGLDGGFWVPAHLHPELAPGEFRAFLKAHTHSDPEHATVEEAGEAAGLARSPSWLSRNGSTSQNGLGRKRSMLSRQYQPKVGDNVEEEVPPLPNTLSRSRPSIYGRNGEKGLTLNDLQKLEELVDEAGEDDPDQMRSLLRRSLSMNVAPGFLEDDIPQEGSDAGLSRPGSILRRSARTKIRKAGLQGDGGGHRFAATRKGRMTAAPVIDIPGLEDDDDPNGVRRGVSPGGSGLSTRTGSDDSEDAIRDESNSSHEHDDDDESNERYHDAIQHIEQRRPSDSSTVETDETHIFDAYARNSRGSSISGDSSSFSGSPSPESSPPNLKLDLPPLSRSPSDWFKDGEKTPTQETIDPLRSARTPSPSESFDERGEMSHRAGLPNLTVPNESSSHQRTPTSPTTPKAPTHDLPPGMAPPAKRTSTPPGIAMQQQLAKESTQPPSRPESIISSLPFKETKEKEKKGGFFSKSKDKDKDKDKDKEKDKKTKKDKDRFLGSLFGGKKKHEEPPSVSSFGTAGPAAAAALLGTSKSAKSLGLSPTPSPTTPGFQTNQFARYPIHVERAVYRLSHIKLANARRPLYEQVLISNLMFWYLGVIGRNVAEEKKANAGGSSGEEDKKNDKAPPAKGTPPKPIDVGSAGKPLPREMPEQVQVQVRERDVAPSGKKTGLTKPDRSRQPGRDAEAPVRSPSYGMQNAQVDSEMRNAGIGMKGPRPVSTGGGPHLTVSREHPPPHSQPPPQHQQPSREAPYAHLQPQRSGSMPPPGATHRALSPPSPGGHSRPASEYSASHGPSPGGPRDPRELRSNSTSPPYGLPNGNLPPGAGPMGQSQSMHEIRDGRQRTYSNPAPPPMQSRDQHYPSHPQAPNQPGQAQMRRVVSEAQRPASTGYDPRDVPPPQRAPPPPQLHPQHSGPQPGQIFHHPSSPSFRPGSPGLAPGQIQPRYPPQQHQAGPPLQYGGQPGQIFRPPPQSVRPPQQGWEPPQRLPPGAGPAPGQVYNRPPQQGYERSFSNPPHPGHPGHPGHPQHHPQSGPMGHSQTINGPPYYGNNGQPQPQRPPGGQVPQFSPYAVPPPPQGREGEYRRPQPVPPASTYHHR